MALKGQPNYRVSESGKSRRHLPSEKQYLKDGFVKKFVNFVRRKHWKRKSLGAQDLVLKPRRFEGEGDGWLGPAAPYHQTPLPRESHSGFHKTQKNLKWAQVFLMKTDENPGRRSPWPQPGGPHKPHPNLSHHRRDPRLNAKATCNFWPIYMGQQK